MPLPPGTTRAGLRRAGIITDPISCPECNATVNEGENHAEWCDCEMSLQEMAEWWADEYRPDPEEY